MVAVIITVISTYCLHFFVHSSIPFFLKILARWGTMMCQMTQEWKQTQLVQEFDSGLGSWGAEDSLACCSLRLQTIESFAWEREGWWAGMKAWQVYIPGTPRGTQKGLPQWHRWSLVTWETRVRLPEPWNTSTHQLLEYHCMRTKNSEEAGGICLTGHI